MAENAIWRSPVSGKRRRGPDRQEGGQGGTCLTAIRPASRCDRHLAGRPYLRLIAKSDIGQRDPATV